MAWLKDLKSSFQTTCRIKVHPPLLYSRPKQIWIPKDTDWDLSRTTGEEDPTRATGSYSMSTVPIISIWDSRRLRMLPWSQGKYPMSVRPRKAESRLTIQLTSTQVWVKSRKAKDPWQVRTSTSIRWTIWHRIWRSLIVKAYCQICRSKEMDPMHITRMWGQMNSSAMVS